MIWGIVVLGIAIALGYWFYTTSSRVWANAYGRRSSNSLASYWQIRQEDARCSALRRQLYARVHRQTAERLLDSVRRHYPGKSEYWYLEKVMYDLRRGR